MTPTILIIEDEHHFSYALELALRARGFATVIATDGLEAMKILEKEESVFSLVLLDLMLPKVSGEEILDYLMEKHSEVPVIVISGHVDIDRYIELMARGCRDILFKPIDTKVLLRRIMEIIALTGEKAKASNG